MTHGDCEPIQNRTRTALKAKFQINGEVIQRSRCVAKTDVGDVNDNVRCPLLQQKSESNEDLTECKDNSGGIRFESHAYKTTESQNK